ncbi:MAG: amidohydrolase, partial [Armatimonadetes bacterium]|nr:amidohydrolase [Armatimonadota bacterium]
WEATRFTGYGEAVRLLAREVYGLEELTGDGLLRAQEALSQLRRPGERYRILHDMANLDHVQIDDFCWPCLPEPAHPEFFLYDINWQGFCCGNLHPNDLPRETGIAATDLKSLKHAQEAIFDRYGRAAIAVKAQHAYSRTLDWRERTDDEAAEALAIIQKEGDSAPEAARLCLGDWSWARGVELAIEHDLPFKIHTGYYAGNWSMPVDRIRSGHLHRLLRRYPKARFVLMHIAYPYSEELIAMAKHYPNVWVDLCWAWSINPRSAAEFVRRFLHAVPVNKLFGFGGDTPWPTSALAYAHQARQGLTRALQGEVEDGFLTEREAMGVATRLMHENAYACFDMEGTRAALCGKGDDTHRRDAEAQRTPDKVKG